MGDHITLRKDRKPFDHLGREQPAADADERGVEIAIAHRDIGPIVAGGGVEAFLHSLRLLAVRVVGMDRGARGGGGFERQSSDERRVGTSVSGRVNLGGCLITYQKPISTT